MKYLLCVVIGIFLCISCQNDPSETQTEEVNNAEAPSATSENENSLGGQEVKFRSTDDIEVVGDLYEVDKQASTILLFHQGGSNARGEYNSMIPKLIEAGYNILAIDQRRGGQTYGSFNRTVVNIPLNGFGYCDAYADLERALDFVIEQDFTGPKIAWGSSYSAALIFQLANKRAEISALLAFSPASGQPLADCDPNQYFETTKVPALVLRPQSEMEFESVQKQFELAKTHNLQTYVSENGVHGSSMLVEERVKGDVEAHWNVVMTFLNKLKSK